MFITVRLVVFKIHVCNFLFSVTAVLTEAVRLVVQLIAFCFKCS